MELHHWVGPSPVTSSYSVFHPCLLVASKPVLCSGQTNSHWSTKLSSNHVYIVRSLYGKTFNKICICKNTYWVKCLHFSGILFFTKCLVLFIIILGIMEKKFWIFMLCNTLTCRRYWNRAHLNSPSHGPLFWPTVSGITSYIITSVRWFSFSL